MKSRRHDSQNRIYIKGKYITIVGRDQPQFDRVNVFIKSVYDIEDNSNCVIFNTIPNQEIEISECRSEFPGKRFILYNFEQITEHNVWMNVKQYLYRMRFFDEIWSYTPSSTKAIREAGYRCEFKPIYYVPSLEFIDRSNPNKEFDLLFVGALSDCRCTQLRNITRQLDYEYSVIMGTGLTGPIYHNLLMNSKVMLNIHGMKSVDQECERLTFHVANRVPIISEISEPSYFEGLIYEYKSTREVPKLAEFVIESYDELGNSSYEKFLKISKELSCSVPRVHAFQGGEDLSLDNWRYINYL